MASSMTKKLLVLDLDGFLVDTYLMIKTRKDLPAQPPDTKFGKYLVYVRPFCREFLKFCFQHFIVGIWSCKKKCNAEKVVRYLLAGTDGQVAFIWHQELCTHTGLKDPDNKFKPMFLKELSKLWTKFKPELPWEEGVYGPTNTLLVDDTPYKALCNPPYTGIFPESYSASSFDDDLLGGQLKLYLQQLLTAVDVQRFVKENPFGQPHLSPKSPLWNHFHHLVYVKDCTEETECEDYSMLNYKTS